MAGRHLPDSLELLLDTMCNTFGGVMFITISMVLMVSAVSRMLSEASPQELDRQVLEEERRRIAALEQEIGRMETRLRLSDSHVVRDDANSREEADLLRKALREAAALESEAAGKQSQLEALEQEISRQRERNAAGAEQLQEEEQRIEAALREEHSQRERRILEREELKKEEAALRPRRIRFAKSEPTDLQPYTIILSGNALHRLGPGGLSCREVEVRREGNLLTLIPRNGVPVSGDIGSAEFSRLFADVDRGRYFVRCFVDPDSFEVFAGLRRRFRENGFRLDWIITEEFLLRLVDRADYSASE